MRAGRGIGTDWGLGVAKVKTVAGGLILRSCWSWGSCCWCGVAKPRSATTPRRSSPTSPRSGAGDSAAACALLSDGARTKLMNQQQAPTCEAAADALAAGLRPEDRDQLAKKISVRQYAVNPSRKEFQLSKAPAGHRRLHHHRLPDRRLGLERPQASGLKVAQPNPAPNPGRRQQPRASGGPGRAPPGGAWGLRPHRTRRAIPTRALREYRPPSSTAPPAGFEPAHPPPEGGALSPELRGLRNEQNISRKSGGALTTGGRGGVSPGETLNGPWELCAAGSGRWRLES